MGVLKSIKTSWINYLNRQAEANKRNFGTTEGLRCCNLQKYDEPHRDEMQQLAETDPRENGQEVRHPFE